ncbi:MAG TPA: gas vesicle protein GvpG, partial [Polyangiaceae bacterium]|nr:gas vesicle protein GvpG [Polyangiaceae bacterium]
MLIVDSLLVGGIKFVLGKIADAVDAELHDDTHLRERLLEAQMRLELGEIDDAEFAALEREVLERLREIKQRQRGEDADTAAAIASGEYKVTGIEASFAGDEHGPAGDDHERGR